MKLLGKLHKPISIAEIAISKTYRLKTPVVNKDFTIISNNCWGAEAYKEVGHPYNTPFVGLFLYGPCYIKLLDDLKANMQKPLRFVTASKYPEANLLRKTKPYPVALIGDDIEVHFLHYSSEVEARTKWERRTARINWNNLFIKFCDRDGFYPEAETQFASMPYKNKVFFSSRRPSTVDGVWVSMCRYDGEVLNGKTLYNVSKKYFDISGWLNREASQ